MSLSICATCNVTSQQTWGLLKRRGIKCQSRKSPKALFTYGGTDPLLTLRTFTADVMLTGCSTGCTVDFVLVRGNGRMLLGRETAGPLQANSVSGQLEGNIRERYTSSFAGVVLLKG